MPVQIGRLVALSLALVLTWIFFTLRIFVRRRIVPRLTAEDWLMVVAQILYTADICIGFALFGPAIIGEHDDFISHPRQHLLKVSRPS